MNNDENVWWLMTAILVLTTLVLFAITNCTIAAISFVSSFGYYLVIAVPGAYDAKYRPWSLNIMEAHGKIIRNAVVALKFW